MCAFPDGAGGRRQEIREFRTTTAGLITLADWLRSFAVTVVGMESTGVYWRAVFYLLEDEFECQLFNARHLRHVPGRKSDVQDAEWGCQLIEHGLVRTSFGPAPAAAGTARPVDGGELAALDLVQHGLAGEPERGGGVGERQPPFGGVLADAGAQLGGDVDLPGRVAGDLLAGDEPFAQPAVDGRG